MLFFSPLTSSYCCFLSVFLLQLLKAGGIALAKSNEKNAIRRHNAQTPMHGCSTGSISMP